MSKRNKRKRTFKARARVDKQPMVWAEAPPESPIQEWQVVMAELKVGTASVGIRFNREDTVQFFELHKTPQEAAAIVARIAKGEMTLQDIANYDWRAIDMPHDYMEDINKEIDKDAR